MLSETEIKMILEHPVFHELKLFKNHATILYNAYKNTEVCELTETDFYYINEICTRAFILANWCDLSVTGRTDVEVFLSIKPTYKIPTDMDWLKSAKPLYDLLFKLKPQLEEPQRIGNETAKFIRNYRTTELALGVNTDRRWRNDLDGETDE